MNKLSEYTYFYILKIITSYIFLLLSKIVESFQCVLNTFKKEFSKPFVDIINLTFSGGTFPETMNVAKIIPVVRKDDKLS